MAWFWFSSWIWENVSDVEPHLKTLESGLKERKFVGGESLGFVELAANVIVWLFVAQEVLGLLTEEKFPTVHEWYQRFADDAVFKECAPPRELFIAYYKALFGASTASKWRVGLCMSLSWWERNLSSHLCIS